MTKTAVLLNVYDMVSNLVSYVEVTIGSKTL